MKHKATCSHAAAVATLLGHWCLGGPDGQVFSLGVLSDGELKIFDFYDR